MSQYKRLLWRGGIGGEIDDAAYGVYSLGTVAGACGRIVELRGFTERVGWRCGSGAAYGAGFAVREPQVGEEVRQVLTRLIGEDNNAAMARGVGG